jgi:hypothetical protein
MLVRTQMFLAAIFCAALSNCSFQSLDSPNVAESTNELRSITNTEALSDFEQLVGEVRANYGALERKESRYGFSFDALVSDYRSRVAAAATEPEYRGLFAEFLAQLRDAHVALVPSIDADESSRFRLPVLVMPIEDKFVVYYVDDDIVDFARGDELLRIDGVPVAALMDRFSVYDGTPNPLMLRHIAATYLTIRPPFIPSGIENGQPVALTFRSSDGLEREVSLRWSEDPHVLPPVAPVAMPVRGSATFAISAAADRVIRAELAYEDASWPFYLTGQVRDQFGVETVFPSDHALAKFNLSAEVASRQRISAFVYTYCGRRILLLRMPDYGHADETVFDDPVNYLRALFFDQAPRVDGLIYDETHNSGGSLKFGTRIAALLTAKPINGFVQQMHADRLWIESYLASVQQIRAVSEDADPPEALELEEYAHQIDIAYSTGQPLSKPLPFPGIKTTIEPDADRWTKPFIVLADELSASVGDVVPLIMKVNHVAPIFGQRTTGAGGSVETVAALASSRFVVDLSRGLGTTFDPTGTYPAENYIEDLGVAPDIEYSHTLADFRAGYVGYVGAFSDALVEEVRRCEQ